MGRGRSNPETVAAQRQVEKNQRAERQREIAKNDLGKGEKPGFGTEAWAREHGLWQEGDTSGPATQS